MFDQQGIHTVAKSGGQHILTVRCAQGRCDFAKDVRCFFESPLANLSSNHVAHGHNRNTGVGENGGEFAFSGPGHAANRHHLSHEGMAMPVAQEDTCSNKASVQFENSARPQRRSISFHNTAEAKINPMEIAIMPMYPCWTIVSSYICAVAARPS